MLAAGGVHIFEPKSARPVFSKTVDDRLIQKLERGDRVLSPSLVVHSCEFTADSVGCLVDVTADPAGCGFDGQDDDPVFLRSRSRAPSFEFRIPEAEQLLFDRFTVGMGFEGECQNVDMDMPAGSRVPRHLR